MQATELQMDFIEKLVDHIGFKGSPYKKKYLTMILGSCRNIQATSEVIGNLINERKLRFKGVKVRLNHPKYIRVTDLSELTFCPASYSIKNSHILPRTSQMQEGEEAHTKFYLEQYLEQIQKRFEEGIYSKKSAEEKRVKFLHIMQKDLVNSKIIYRGHTDDDAKIYFNKTQQLAGKPDYILERNNSEKFVLEEKHTWGELTINRPWNNHIIQIMGYINLLQNYNINEGYLIYFKWGYYRGEKTIQKVRIYRIAKTEGLQKKFQKTLEDVSNFKTNKKIQFDLTKLNLKKCLGCSARPWCRHKSGRFDVVNFPYYHS